MSKHKWDSEKVSLAAIPTIECPFLPAGEELLRLFGCSKDRFRKLLNNDFSCNLKKGTHDNLNNGVGVRFSTLRKSVLEPALGHVDSSTVTGFRRQYRRMWRERQFHFRNTIEWESFASVLPEGSITKRFLQERVGWIVDVRKSAARGYIHKADGTSVDLLLRILPCGISKSVIDDCCEAVNSQSPPGNEKCRSEHLEYAVRYLVASRMDFYLALLATTDIAHIFQVRVIPKFLQISTGPRSLVSAVLDWLRWELGYKSWNEFELDFSAPIDESSVADVREYADSKMKRWRRSTNTCYCTTKKVVCKHSGISNKDIALVCSRLESHQTDLDLNLVATVLYVARALDGLQREIKISLVQSGVDKVHLFNSAEECYRENLSRFETYLNLYGRRAG